MGRMGTESRQEVGGKGRVKISELNAQSNLQTTFQGTHFLRGSAFFFPYYKPQCCQRRMYFI